jgi:4'-phosphopantetheinyl transferase
MTCWLSRSVGDVPAGEAWLGPAERAALGGLALPKRRDDWRLGRYTAKVAICLRLGVDPGRVEVLAMPGGAPVARLDGERAELELSISHRAGRALVVLAPFGTPVGCDLELIEPRSAAFVCEWLAPSEQQLVNAAPPRERAYVANLIWSAKEASAKARGEGLRLNVRHAEVVIGEPARGEGDWRPLCVEWGSGPEAGSGSGRDTGWARREQRWVLTVVGGGAGPPRALVAHRGAPEGSTTMAQAATKSPPFGFAPGNRPSPSV